MSEHEDTMEWLRQRQRERLEQAREDAARWFAEFGTDAIPDLEFETPVCPVCDLYTDFEDGRFECENCGLHWSHRGEHGEIEPDHPLHATRSGDQ